MKDREIEAEWSPQENLHVTLVFLGERSAEELPQITETLRKAALLLPSFRIKTKGLGAFPELDSARILFADVVKSRDLLTAQSVIEEALGLQGTDMHDYHPHITLARLRNLKSLRKVTAPWRKGLADTMEANAFCLFKSVVSGPYRRYVPLEVFNLQKPT